MRGIFRMRGENNMVTIMTGLFCREWKIEVGTGMIRTTMKIEGMIIGGIGGNTGDRVRMIGLDMMMITKVDVLPEEDSPTEMTTRTEGTTSETGSHRDDTILLGMIGPIDFLTFAHTCTYLTHETHNHLPMSTKKIKTAPNISSNGNYRSFSKL